MIVPDFWAEAKRKEVINGSQFTIKRFGWSNESEEHAFKNAKERVDEAMLRALNGEKVRKFDRKISYNGSEGLPIREEVISRHGDVVITRNVYGSLCLNTPDVLFADIDLSAKPTTATWRISLLIAFMAAVFLGFWYVSWPMFFASLLMSLLGTLVLAQILQQLSFFLFGSPEKQFRKALKTYAANHQGANLRLYKTPNGFRVLALHKLFDPNDEEVEEMFLSLKVDKIYFRMCRNQKCFRARVSPKPWRMGFNRIGPGQGVWPVKKKVRQARNVWISSYEKASTKFASCVFDSAYGGNTIHPKAKLVLQLHDDFSQAESNHTIA